MEGPEHKHLREMAILGELSSLQLGVPVPAYVGKDRRIEGYLTILKIFENLKEIITDSDWWWISSGTDTHNRQGRSQGIEFRFTSESYFSFRCIYDLFVGFTKMEIGYDDIDTKVIDPERMTIDRL